MKYIENPWGVMLAVSRDKNKTIKEFSKFYSGEIDWPVGNASTTWGTGEVPLVIVTVMPQKISKIQMAGLAAHEACHVWEAVNEWMNAKDPEGEHRAYAIQWITHKILEVVWK